MADEIEAFKVNVQAIHGGPSDALKVSKVWVGAIISDSPPPPRVRSRASVRGHLLQRFTQL